MIKQVHPELGAEHEHRADGRRYRRSDHPNPGQVERYVPDDIDQRATPAADQREGAEEREARLFDRAGHELNLVVNAADQDAV